MSPYFLYGIPIVAILLGVIAYYVLREMGKRIDDDVS